MRFILNFFFYGLLFYLIYLFFPDAFHTLVSWANNVYDFLREAVLSLTGKLSSPTPTEPAHEPAPQTALLLACAWRSFRTESV